MSPCPRIKSLARHVVRSPKGKKYPHVRLKFWFFLFLIPRERNAFPSNQNTRTIYNWPYLAMHSPDLQKSFTDAFALLMPVMWIYFTSNNWPCSPSYGPEVKCYVSRWNQLAFIWTCIKYILYSTATMIRGTGTWTFVSTSSNVSIIIKKTWSELSYSNFSDISIFQKWTPVACSVRFYSKSSQQKQVPVNRAQQFTSRCSDAPRMLHTPRNLGLLELR